ncbi:MAG: hypothetical protein LIP77_07320 [Planctomycetes bacterium]|nr:hypothetical protein [Planctomycetota bacterium]
MNSTKTTFTHILSDFKGKENPEAILIVGEDPLMVRLTLAWPNVLIVGAEPSVPFSKQWNEVERWNWLWQNVHYLKKDVHAVVGRTRLDTQLRSLIANRILYPDGTVHSYVLRFFRSRVIKLLEKKPVVRRTAGVL